MSQSSFEIKTSKDLYLKLIREHERLLADLHSPDHAINFSITAHHLFKDWLRRELSLQSYEQLESQLNDSLKKEIGIIRDICDGTKHLKLDRPPHVQISDSKVNQGTFSAEFSREFDVGGLVVTLHDGTEMYFDNVADTVVDFWKKYFDSKNSKDDVPPSKA